MVSITKKTAKTEPAAVVKVAAVEDVAKEEQVQPEINIGMVGHVDHGKCISKHESVLLNNKLMRGEELAELAVKEGKKVKDDGEGSFYELPKLSTYAFDENGDIVRSPATVYIQHYKGSLRRILTRTGRSITLTKTHPLLRNTGGKLCWVPAGLLKEEDTIALLKSLPLADGTIEFKRDYLSELSKHYYVFSEEDVSELQGLIKDSALFNRKNANELVENIRLLCKYPIKKFCKDAKVDERAYRKFLANKKPLSIKNHGRLELFAKSLNLPKLPEGTLFLASKKGVMRKEFYATFKDLAVTRELVRFVALLTAEGYASQRRLLLCQKNYPKVLEETVEFLRTAGASSVYVTEKDVHINNRAFVDYLRAKFLIQIGAAREATLPSWLLSLPRALKAEFVRTFFTLESNVNPLSLQVVLTQANKSTINTLSYMLLSFGIFPLLGEVRKSATNAPKPQKRLYYTLTISGRDNLALFKELIGFEEANLISALDNCITEYTSKKVGGMPINVNEVSQLLWEVFRRKNSANLTKKNMKKRGWYKGWEEAKKRGCLSQNLWQKIKSEILDELEVIRTASRYPITWKNAMDAASISFEELAKRLKEPRTNLIRELKARPSLKTLETLKLLIIEKVKLIEQKLNHVDSLFALPLAFDKIVKIEDVPYNDVIVDLHVPKHASFFAGYGGILCHNTTLVEAITGRWTDTHSEEIKRGITIRLGYADAEFRKCPKCPEPSCFTTKETCSNNGCGEKTVLVRKASFVDAPGHESLMATMLSGAAIMDGALLLIAANEKCPQPQTKEHFVALQIVGIKRVVIVQNKIDLVSEEEANENYKQIKEFVKGTPYEKAPVVPISAQSRVNIDVLIQAIQESIPTPERKKDAEPLFFVARSFDINRPGTLPEKMQGGVLGGAVRQGIFAAGKEIEIRPGRRVEKAGKASWLPIATKIVALKTGGGNVNEVSPGGSVGILTSLDPGIVKADSLTGTVVGLSGKLPPVWQEFKAEVRLLERVVGAKDELVVEPLKQGETLMLNVNSSATVGIVAELKKNIALLRLKLPVCAEPGSRVTLSRLLGSRWRLIGYGIIKAQ